MANMEGDSAPPSSPKPAVEDLCLEFENRLDREKLERQRELISQEHRLIPAIVNLVNSFSMSDVEEGRRRRGPAVSALFWCLIPTPAAAGVGIVAILSLIVSWQQMRLLRVQNDRVQTQNILSEAQRRSGLVFESTAVLEQIEKEKAQPREKPDAVCGADFDQCWHEIEGRRVFIPSEGTSGRLVALTQALRPYRYLSVETGAPYRLVSERDQRTVCPSEIADAGVSGVQSGWIFPEGNEELRPDLSNQRKSAIEAYNRTPSGRSWLASLPARLGAVLDNEGPARLEAELNCAPSSPERGQLLLSLHSARVDLTYLGKIGADFRYSDIPGARFREMRLDGLDLSFSRLPGASFQNASLSGVDFTNADLAGAHFSGATLKNIVFKDTTLQSIGDGGAFAGLFRAKSIDGTSLWGIRIVEEGDQTGLFQRMCVAGMLANRLGRTQGINVPDDRDAYRAFRKHALLTETSFDPDRKRLRRVAYIVPQRGSTSTVLFTRGTQHMPNYAQLEYDPFVRCQNWPDARAGQPKS